MDKSSSTYYNQVQEATHYIRRYISENIKLGVVLGSGLGNFTARMTDVQQLDYSQIPHFPTSTVKGHAGCLLIGRCFGIPTIAQSGRFHFYEGYDMKQVTFPIRVFGELGVQTLLIASAVGGIHEDYYAGDVAVITDHINLNHENPLSGANEERWGPRFPDMSEPYDLQLISQCHDIARSQGIVLHNAVYAGLPGPNLETKAEYRYLNTIGATVVGMSTVSEVIVARHMDIKVCVLTAITNKCFPIDAIHKTTHDDVIRVAGKAEKKISAIAEQLISNLI